MRATQCNTLTRSQTLKGIACPRAEANLPQSDLAKTRIAEELAEKVWPLLDAGRIAPVMDQVFALEDAAKAHARMETSAHIGKIVLEV